MQWGLKHMEIKNRLFPYPVLCVENDDYTNCSFDVKTKVKEDINDIILDFDILLENNEELRWLIRDGYAKVVIHIECSSTAFRTMVIPVGNKKTVRIPKSIINNVINLLGAIVADKDIVGFKSKLLNEDYDEEISFNRGSILAYRNLPKIYISKNYEELVGDDSFFTVIKRMDIEEVESLPVIYDITDSKIKILVSEKTYNEYIKYHANPIMQPLLNTLLVMPAIAYMVDELRSCDDIEQIKPLYWFQRISKSYKMQGKDFINDIINSDSSCVEIAQSMLQMPIEKAFECLSKVIEE